MTSFCQLYGVYATSHILCINIEATVCLRDATLQGNKLCQNCFSRVLSSGAEQLYCNVEEVLENTYILFYILYNAFQLLLLVDTNKQNIDSFAF